MKVYYSQFFSTLNWKNGDDNDYDDVEQIYAQGLVLSVSRYQDLLPMEGFLRVSSRTAK